MRTYLQKVDADVENIKERALSSCDLQKRKALLEAKQEVISDVLERAYNTLLSADY